MRKATEAMRQNTSVLLESQKPKIAAKPHGNPTNDLADRNCPRVQIEIYNRGQSAAYDLVYESWIELLPFPFVDFTPSADHHKASEGKVLNPNHTPITINIPKRKGITDQQLSDLKQLRLYACIRVRVEYRDAFSTNRYAEFGYCVMANGLGFLPKYNDAN